MHAPCEIDVKHLNKLIPSLRVVLAANGVEEGNDVDIGANDGVQDPLEAEVSDALETLLERVDACNGDGVGRGHALTGEQAQKSRLTGAIGYLSQHCKEQSNNVTLYTSDQERSAARWQVQEDFLQTTGSVWERIAEVLHVN